ncbi:MAG: NAD(P)-dependent oxidoreductase, partial [Balneolaceae bacterium]
MINVLADRYLFNIQSYLPENINLILFDPAEGLPDISSVHALLIRTVIQINKTTLPAIPKSLEFVGTASAGTDHVDISYLESHGVQFANAVGCNARSVAEYVATALLIWSDQRQKTLTELSMGVIGVGNVGTHVIRLMNKLGVSTTAYDPPREQRDPTFSSNSLEELLATDILSFHTPLTRDGAHPTYHWLDTKKLIKQNYEL